MDKITDLLDKPMDRKDFLRQVGVGGLLLLGSGLIGKTVLGLGSRTKKNVPRGYGASAYGGTKQ